MHGQLAPRLRASSKEALRALVIDLDHRVGVLGRAHAERGPPPVQAEERSRDLARRAGEHDLDGALQGGRQRALDLGDARDDQAPPQLCGLDHDRSGTEQALDQPPRQAFSRHSASFERQLSVTRPTSAGEALGNSAT